VFFLFSLVFLSLCQRARKTTPAAYIVTAGRRQPAASRTGHDYKRRRRRDNDMSDDFDDDTDGKRSNTFPLKTVFVLHPAERWYNAVFWVSMLSGAAQLFCALFWYLETVGANFVHQWALTFSALALGVVGIVTLVFLIPMHLSRVVSTSLKDNGFTYPFSPWHRWALWGQWVALVLQVGVATASMAIWLDRANFGWSSARFDPTLAPASQASIQYYQSTGYASSAPAVALLFATLYAAWRHYYPEAVGTVIQRLQLRDTPAGSASADTDAD
jgi:hypothetical protein